MRNVYDVHEFRARRALDAAYLQRAYDAAEEYAHLQEASSRTHKKVAGVSREHDRGTRRVDPLVAQFDGRLAQPLPRLPQLLGQVLCQHGFRRRPAVVRFAFRDPLLAVITLASTHPVIHES